MDTLLLQSGGVCPQIGHVRAITGNGTRHSHTGDLLKAVPGAQGGEHIRSGNQIPPGIGILTAQGRQGVHRKAGTLSPQFQIRHLQLRKHLRR